jgi:BclB C-terminal domain-containing protein
VFPISLTTLPGGVPGLSAALPLSGDDSGPIPAGGPSIDLTTAVSGAAQLFPRAGTVTSISARFSTTVALTEIGTTVTISAQLHTGPGTGNILNAVAPVNCTLSPQLTGIVAIGTVVTCSATGLAVPIPAGTLGLVVFSATATGLSLVNTVSGYAQASLTFA